MLSISLPRFGRVDHLWLNGLYEAACVILVFPLVVAIGAGDEGAEGTSLRVAMFFGELSFPLYITHYPLIYIYTAWVTNTKPSPMMGTLVGTGLLVAALALAFASLKLIDEPARRWLGFRFLRRP